MWRVVFLLLCSLLVVSSVNARTEAIYLKTHQTKLGSLLNNPQRLKRSNLTLQGKWKPKDWAYCTTNTLIIKWNDVDTSTWHIVSTKKKVHSSQGIYHLLYRRWSYINMDQLIGKYELAGNKMTEISKLLI